MKDYLVKVVYRNSWADYQVVGIVEQNSKQVYTIRTNFYNTERDAFGAGFNKIKALIDPQVTVHEVSFEVNYL